MESLPVQLEIDLSTPAEPAFEPARSRWESATRWYTVVLEPDLFGTWVLTRCWGSRSTRLFGVLQQLPSTPAAAAKTIRTVGRRRDRSGTGYVKVA